MINCENLKKSAVKPLDVIILLFLAGITAIFFLFPVYSATDVMEVTINGERIMSYDFSLGSYEIYNSEAVQPLGNDKFKLISGGGYNLLAVDRSKREAFIYETDCGTTKECTKMLLSEGSIICVPHGLVVKFSGKASSPVVG